VNKIDTDISIIRKYLNGELDGPAMHQLEKRAQDDPFLMDAIEGYEKAAGNQQNQLDELAARINQRVEPKKAKVIPFKMIGIAASILVVLSIGGWWLFNNNQHADKPQLAATVAPEVTKVTIDSVHTAINTQTPLASLSTSRAKAFVHYNRLKAVVSSNVAPVSADNAVAKKDSVTTDSTPLNEMVVMQYTAAPQQKGKALAKAKVTMDTAIAMGIKKQQNPIDKLLEGKVAGVNTQPADFHTSAGKNLDLYDSNYLSKAYIRGQVISKDDGLPLPGAIVKIAGTNKAAQTDANGRFNIALDSTKTNQLDIGYIGYQSRHISANNRDSLKTIVLQPNNNSLGEVVVTGYGAQRKTTDDDTFVAARPINGWSSFKKYLKENAISPDNKTGTVKLAVTINGNGVITNVKVVKGLSTQTDQKAIKLVNNGPRWSASSDGNPQIVTVKVKFED
jgi:TonB family protein